MFNRSELCVSYFSEGKYPSKESETEDLNEKDNITVARRV